MLVCKLVLFRRAGIKIVCFAGILFQQLQADEDTDEDADEGGDEGGDESGDEGGDDVIAIPVTASASSPPVPPPPTPASAAAPRVPVPAAPKTKPAKGWTDDASATSEEKAQEIRARIALLKVKLDAKRSLISK